MRRIRRAALALSLCLAASSTAASAASEACREWWNEHQSWKAEVVHRHLAGHSQRALDEAVFELLQREAWLTSCERSARLGRDRLVGFRLVGQLPENYSGVVVETILEQAGFDLELQRLIGDAAKAPPLSSAATPSLRSGRSLGPGSR
ncbi:MAG: hypothetical protein QNK05_13670 [Myxococcota bacterium]|nr:hypothetical protein [Myxococcota bacterium]